MSRANKFFYDSLEDASRRLQGTVVLHKNLGPVYVSGLQGLNTDQYADVVPLPTGRRGEGNTTLPLTPKEFEIHKLPSLGYVDTADYSFYLNRRSNRQGKQGFCRTNINIPNNNTGRVPAFENLLASRQFLNMLTNKYPKMEEVFDKVLKSEEPIMQSFSKIFALSIDDMESVSLWNRGLKVAVANNPKKYGPQFRLPPKFQYLREELQENGIRIEG